MINRRFSHRRKRQPSGSAGLLLVMLLYVSAHAAIDRLGPVPADAGRGHSGQFQDADVPRLASQGLPYMDVSSGPDSGFAFSTGIE